MPEEVNRVVTDRLADLLFTHSAEADENLRAEGAADDRIHFVGNVMIDTLLRARPLWQGRAREALGELPERYGVVTLHRPANVDDPAGLTATVAALDATAAEIPLIFPVHPRTRARMSGMSAASGLRVIDPLPYMPFLDLVEHASVVLTDSGGIQEETTVLGVPCLTLRDNTERPVTVRAGTNRLVGTNPAAVQPAVRQVLAGAKPPASAPPLWDGHAAERIAAVLAAYCTSDHKLRLAA
jgi:UDP-N-acetylglucosamine 2-epimerase (non-hydrolysing)